MQKKNYNLDDVEIFLKDFGFEWLERLVYNPNTNKYKKARTNIFNGEPVFLSLKNTINGKRTLMLAEIDNEKFKMSAGTYKIEASLAWQEFINEKIIGAGNEC